MEKDKSKKRHSILDIISNIIFVILLIFVGILLIFRIFDRNAAVGVFGNYVFKVASGSMVPTIKVGDYILVKKTDEYKKGDIITYTTKENNITHRIIKINDDGTIVTKGDANNTEDKAIKKSQVVGVYKRKLKVFKIFIDNFIYITGVLLIIYLSSLVVHFMKKLK